MKARIISFDFDDTLTKPHCRNVDGLWISYTGPNESMVAKLRQYAEQGHTVVIVTYRDERHEAPEWIEQFMPSRLCIRNFVEEHDLPVTEIHFTNHQPKGPVLKQIGAVRHYDDCPEAIYSATAHGIEGILVTPE